MVFFRKITGTTYAVVIAFATFVYFLYVFNYTVRVTETHLLAKKHEKSSSNEKSSHGEFVDIMFTFTNVKKNELFIKKFHRCISTLLNHSSVPLKIHLITDEDSKPVAEEVIKREVLKDRGSSSFVLKPKICIYNIVDIIKDVSHIIDFFRKHFSYKPGTYYSNALFYLSPGLHKVQSFSDLKNVIIFDVDIEFEGDIKDLNDYFRKFEHDMVIGMSNEQQPVYRHLLGLFRSQNPGTMIGDPPKSGFPGYNSGVVLLNLTKMRESVAYNTYLNANEVQNLVKKFQFKGHLGDQDFYTLLSFENPQLFYTLPCSWNRQLCEWWKLNGYQQEFQSYHSCEEKIMLYHGNCNTHIPWSHK